VETGRYANEVASYTPCGWPVLQSPLRVETSLAPAKDRDVRVPADAEDVVDGVSYVFHTRLSVTKKTPHHVQPNRAGLGDSSKLLGKVRSER